MEYSNSSPLLTNILQINDAIFSSGIRHGVMGEHLYSADGTRHIGMQELMAQTRATIIQRLTGNSMALRNSPDSLAAHLRMIRDPDGMLGKYIAAFQSLAAMTPKQLLDLAGTEPLPRERIAELAGQFIDGQQQAAAPGR